MKLRYLLPCSALLASPLLFAQEGTITQEPEAITPAVVDPDEALAIAEVMPVHPGGEEAMFKYLMKELKYPELAVENGIQGVVYVNFVVERDGTITTIRVLRGIGAGCDEEAMRVVRNMPPWSPGLQGGRPVRVMYNLPIRFKL
ncbi:MAG: energy transducer TonB [Flavobacteriales bacterium]|nr:energy transducer TonB [Flavobacteriales bacterium]